VRRNEKIERPISKSSHDAIALLLRQPTMNRLGAITARGQYLFELIDFSSRATKHNRGSWILYVENSSECCGFLLALHHVRDLMNPGDCTCRQALSRGAAA